jgi:MFS family permease
MDLARKAGIAVVFGIPAIVGSGLTWQLTHSWQGVFTYLGILGFIVLAFVANPEGVFWKNKHSE